MNGRYASVYDARGREIPGALSWTSEGRLSLRPGFLQPYTVYYLNVGFGRVRRVDSRRVQRVRQMMQTVERRARRRRRQSTRQATSVL